MESKIESINYEEFKVKTPFPKVTTNTKEPVVLQMLIDSYAGSKSEFTAIMQYLYHGFLFRAIDGFKNFEHIMMEIAETEMHHFSIVCNLIQSMGGSPKYCTYIDSNENICKNWTASNVNYMTEMRAFLEFDINLEKSAIREYKEIIRISNDENVKEVIKRIIEDEESHIRIFTAMIEALE